MNYIDYSTCCKEGGEVECAIWKRRQLPVSYSVGVSFDGWVDELMKEWMLYSIGGMILTGGTEILEKKKNNASVTLSTTNTTRFGLDWNRTSLVRGRSLIAYAYVRSNRCSIPLYLHHIEHAKVAWGQPSAYCLPHSDPCNCLLTNV
jgi:hypothetical protein